MTLQKVNTRNTVLVLMIVAAAAFRFVSYKYPYVLSNFTPVGAIALFGGAYFTDKWKAFLVPLVTLFVSDILLNYLYTSKLELFYSGAIWVYLCFAIIVFVGTLIKKATVVSVLLSAIVAVAIHWLIMDLPWLYGNLYPHNLAGYGQSLVAAIPFEKNMLFGDLLFGLILFGGFEFAKSKYGALRTKTELAV
ncbi:MAG TPA: DUF6580 family putative transport protein [Mucilaginibacter sp.]|jgi:hypothetical protein|nr:DUF6580 family putative transport protein [Mucilaginibacter sp.]